MEEGALRGLLEIAARENDVTPEALEAYRAQWIEHAEQARVRDGVAILDLRGPLFKRANLFQAMSGATSYEVLRRDFASVVDDQTIGAILLHVDSPGGEALGTAELAEAIYAARGTKPIVAYVGGLGASAAYWLASAADEIVVDATAIVGSIGVRMAVRDTRAAEEKAGIRRIEFVSSQSPAKIDDPATDEGRARIQKTIDALAEVFIGAVARNRGVSREAVLERFGQGGTEVGQAAVDAGLADRLGSFEGVFGELAAKVRERSASFGGFVVGATGGIGSKGSPMADESKAPVATAPEITVEAIAKDHPTIAAHFRKEGATAERERIQKIQAIALPGYEAQMTEAITAGTAPEAFAMAIVEGERAKRGARLEAIKGDEAEIKPPAPGAAAGEGDDVEATVAAIMKAGK
jgi:signal peptide peptidase SppA